MATWQQMQSRIKELEDFINWKQGGMGGAYYQSKAEIGQAVTWAQEQIRMIQEDMKIFEKKNGSQAPTQGFNWGSWGF